MKQNIEAIMRETSAAFFLQLKYIIHILLENNLQFEECRKIFFVLETQQARFSSSIRISTIAAKVNIYSTFKVVLYLNRMLTFK